MSRRRRRRPEARSGATPEPVAVYRFCAWCGELRADVRPAPDIFGTPDLCDACWSCIPAPASPRWRPT